LEWLKDVLLAGFRKFGIGAGIRFKWNGNPTKMSEPKMLDTLTLERMIFTDTSTIGELRIDGDLLCYTLEDTCRNHKIDSVTAIPAGKYKVIVTESKRFKRPLPLLVDVPNFEGIRIHPGNTSEDTEGCILVGMRKGDNRIYDSRKAFDLLFPEIQKRTGMGDLWIAVVGGVHEFNKEAA
jgi:hypothetical protein